MSEVLLAAFKVLGTCPSHRELGLVATAVRDSGDSEVLALWDGPEYGPGYERLVELAEQAGAGGFVALDLYCEVSEPGAVSEYGGAKALGERVSGRGG